MDAFDRSRSEASSYPCNLVFPETPALILDGIREELQLQAPRLFCEEASASVDIIEIQSPGQDYLFKCVRNGDDLQKVLESAIVQQRRDPSCRMIFLYALSGLDRLYVTLPMLQRILSYHQVMPAFLDNIFMFGFREDSEDCASTTFQSCNRLSEFQRGLEVPELGRSGRSIEHCYGLRSVEKSSSQENWPWSVRTCSIYHSFDVWSGQATWIVVKANRLIEKLIRDSMRSQTQRNPIEDENGRRAFIATLHVHQLVATWTGNNWQWYITFLEKVLQDISRPALSVTMGQRSKTVQFTDSKIMASPTQTSFSEDKSGEKLPLRTRTSSSIQAFSRRVRSFRTTSRSTPEAKQIQVSQHQFSFHDLPTLHFIEERANEALHIISNNDEVLEYLKSSYSEIINGLGPKFNSDEVTQAFDGFFKAISQIQKNLRIQQCRVNQLLKLLKHRKALISGILAYESMAANQLLAEKAGVSADNMEQLAVKTKLETVSMRIITLVTLFFLPGTFISTLMSTPIVRFATGSPSISDSEVSRGALGFYCAVSVPLVVVTFAAWYVVYWWENRKETKRQKQLKSKSATEKV